MKFDSIRFDEGEQRSMYCIKRIILWDTEKSMKKYKAKNVHYGKIIQLLCLFTILFHWGYDQRRQKDI